MDYPEGHEIRAGDIHVNSPELLSCRNLAIGYSSKKGGVKRVSENLNITLEKGELVSLIGPNGSGKSTLIRTLTALQPSLEGEVRINGRDINSFSPEEKAKTMSVVLTTPVQAGNMTAFDIVALGRYPYTNWARSLGAKDEEVVTNSLASTGAEDLAHRFIHELSDGERQKVMIARAIAQDPDLMVLDEPTAYLDLPHKIEIMRVLKQVAHKYGRTILLSTHDLNLAIKCSDRMWIMKGGGEFRSGTPEDLILSGELESAFNLGGVRFDRMKGDFTIPVEKTGMVLLKGEQSAEYTWTVNALERTGIEIAGGPGQPEEPSSPEDSCIISIEKTDEGSRWIVRKEDTQFGMTCESIGELVSALLFLFKGGGSD
ncbi:ABC transporter ATP-binding protein [Methanolacinia petrolearia]|uniref:ABC transporter ATP-binding protein n=1 Tax=Methanolacinia petrolearia TaxID=54120 RepID=UPI003BAACE44